MIRNLALLGALALAACAPSTETAVSESTTASRPAKGPAAELSASVLGDQVAKFSIDLLEGNHGKVFDLQPPLYRRALAAQTDLTRTEFRERYIERQTEGSKSARLVSITIGTSLAYLRYAGTNVSFAVLPTTRVVRGADGRTTTFEGSTIARSTPLGGFWFLILDNVEQLRTLQKVYPELRTIKWPGLRIK